MGSWRLIIHLVPWKESQNVWKAFTAPANKQVGAPEKTWMGLLLIFRCIELSVHRTQLMKESHDHLLQLCSPSDENFLNIEVPPTKLAKRKKGNLPPHSRPLVSDRYHQVLGGSTTSPGSTVRKGSHPAQAQLRPLPHHETNVQNHQGFDDEAGFDCKLWIIVWYTRYINDTRVGVFACRLPLEVFLLFFRARLAVACGSNTSSFYEGTR